MKIFLRLFLLVIVASIALIYLFRDAVPFDQFVKTVDNSNIVEQTKLVIAPKGKIKVTIADSDTSRQRGLSGVTDLADDAGLLFIFPQAGLHGFWMKDMNFALDLVWIDINKTIVDITENVKPETYPNVFYPPSLILYVLEIKGGSAAQFDLKQGIRLDF